MEDALTTDFWGILLWSFWFFIWVAAFTVWLRCLFDLFADSSLSGWAKAGWVALMVLIPWIGALIYLIARNRSMSERQRAIAEYHAYTRRSEMGGAPLEPGGPLPRSGSGTV